MASQPDLSARWLQSFVARARVDCDQLFDYRCPRYWGSLERVSDTVRHCKHCDRPVYLVSDRDELQQRAERGECVAVIVADELPSMYQANEPPPEARMLALDMVTMGVPRVPDE
ncbi:MAG: hypothetical protein AAGC55_04255 [Myxococcota bacterium]